jgi:hypothetical protein
VRRVGDVVQIRDSFASDKPILAFPADAFDAFLAGVKRGDFDLR